MSVYLDTPEIPWLITGIMAYFVGSVTVWLGVIKHRNYDRAVLLSLFAGVICFTVAITVRWLRTDYGPFLTLFEVLLSNLFSLGLIYTLVYWRYPQIRSGTLIVLPLLLFLGMWILIVPSEPGMLPATYQTLWLWVHVGVGKIFLGLCLVAVGLAATLLLRKLVRSDPWLSSLPNDQVLDSVVWRFIAAAFVFLGLGLTGDLGIYHLAAVGTQPAPETDHSNSAMEWLGHGDRDLPGGIYHFLWRAIQWCRSA